MSVITINHLPVYYEEFGSGKKTMVLLHGWGQNTEMMKAIALYFAAHFRVVAIDFPGFGKSAEPSEAYSVEDYMKWLRALLQELNVENPIFIAHSFGCRVALHYAKNFPVRKMVLTGAAGVRDKRTWQWYYKTYSYKAMKKLFSLPFLKNFKEQIQGKVGSSDYRQASGVMRQTLVRVVNDDVSSFLKDIQTETLLVFGENDEATPLSKGRFMEKEMQNATLVIFEKDDHYAYFHQADRFNRVLEAFLRDEYSAD